MQDQGFVITNNAPGYWTVARTGWDTCGYRAHVLAYNRFRYDEIEPAGFLAGSHDHVAQYYSRKLAR